MKKLVKLGLLLSLFLATVTSCAMHTNEKITDKNTNNSVDTEPVSVPNCIIGENTNLFYNRNLENIKHVFFQQEPYTGNFDSFYESDNNISVYVIYDETNGNKAIVSGNGHKFEFQYTYDLFKGINETVESIEFSGIDFSRLYTTCGLFNNCKALTSLNLSNFDTSNVTEMHCMFQCCYSLKSLDVSNFDTSNVTNMWFMFSGCNALESLDVSSFDTSIVSNMCWMFQGCSSLNSLDLSNFDTSNVTDMSSMFYNCSSLTSLDLSNFDTSNVTDMSRMFSDCSVLQTIYVSEKFVTTNCNPNSSNMFYNCENLVGTSNTGKQTCCKLYTYYDISYAKIPQGDDDHGFFTAKPVSK